MNIELTPEQQHAMDNQVKGPQRVIDTRTDTAYILVPESEYQAMRELFEEERREQIIHAVALRNAAGRMDELS